MDVELSSMHVGIVSNPDVQPNGASLSGVERILVQLRDELYGGDWDAMSRDLERRSSRCCLHPTARKNCRHDLKIIPVLRDYESRYSYNLNNLL